MKLPKLQNRYGAQMSGSVENGFTMNSNSWGQRMNTLGDEYYDTANSPYHLTRNAYDISDFMPLLGLLGAGTHNFIIKATDAQGTTTETLILVTE